MPEQKTVKPEKVGQDPLDNFIKQAIGKEPFLSFSRAGDSPVQWIQLLHALDQQGSSKLSKSSKADNGVGGTEHSLEPWNCLSSEINGVKEFVHPLKDAGAPPREKKSTSEQMQALKIPEAVVAFAQAAAKANGEPEKCMSSVKAWLTDKDAEALRCQKLLVEEEEAARKRQADLLERKRMKKLRQKEQKVKDLTDADNRVHSPGTMECTSGSIGTPSPRAPSESDLYAQEASIDQDPQPLEPAGSPDPVAETNFRLYMPTEDADQNMDHLKQMENRRGQPTVAQYRLSKPSRNFRNGFYSGQVPVAKSSISMKHGNYKYPKAAPSANWHKIWTRKSKPDNEEEGSSDRVDREHRDQPVIIDNSEVLIGSISVTLGRSNDCCQDSSSPCCSCYQEKLVKPVTSMNDVNCARAKLWKPVACQDNCEYATIRSDKRENKMVGHSAGTASQISCDQSCLASGGMDGAGSERCKDLLALHGSTNLSGPMLLSVKDAEAFLAQSDGLGAEIIGTFVLVYTVFSATDAKRNARDSHVPILAPLPIGFAVFLVHLATIPITGTGINPARSLGAAIIYDKDHAWDDQWIFWVGPFIGAALAAFYHQIVIRAIPFKSRP
ncbi:hypothetical protein COCNU_08G010450 [Cocos nucifera]|uniref:Uncharacterized protein n=1 Tax=Cocos nucifera TaxID=13894 RepID=A0A8K0IIM2_COCNU|nr:hypothetical protein COCNU_08G010450 [Cocos nucifera]